MAASPNLIYVALILLFFPFSEARSPVLVLPVKKIQGSRQYVTQIYRGNTPAGDELVVDLGGSSLWVNCDSERGTSSSTRRPARCRSAQCSLAGSTRCRVRDGMIRPGCDGTTGDAACLVFPENPVTGVSSAGELVEDAVAVRSANGRVSSFPRGFLFACGSAALLRGLAVGANGVAGLGRSRLTLPSQLSAALGYEYRKFALCLSSYSDGVVFFGDGPYNNMLLSGNDVSKSLTYTPLITRNAGGDIPRPSDEYLIGLKSIKINRKRIPLNSSTLLMVAISTVAPYTTLETAIFTAVVDEFVNSAESMGLGRAAAVAPFSACFSADNRAHVVPTIDLVLQSELVYWRISGANSMITFAEKGVMCLALMDAGPEPATPIVVGGHQLEDNLLQFDVAASRLGFTRSTCRGVFQRLTSNSSVNGDVSSL